MLCDRRKRRKTVEKLVRCDCGKAMKMFQTWHTIDFSLPMHYFKHVLCFSSNHLVGNHFERFFSKILKTHKLISINFSITSNTLFYHLASSQLVHNHQCKTNFPPIHTTIFTRKIHEIKNSPPTTQENPLSFLVQGSSSSLGENHKPTPRAAKTRLPTAMEWRGKTDLPIFTEQERCPTTHPRIHSSKGKPHSDTTHTHVYCIIG